MVRSSLLIGDLILIRGNPNNLVDDAILLADKLEGDKGVYSHVALYIGNNQLSEAQGGRLSGIYPLSEYSSYDVGHINLTPNQRLRISQTTPKFSGRHYGWFSIVAIIIELLTGIVIPFPPRNSSICTQHINSIFKSALGFKLSNKPFPLPDDIAFSPFVAIRRE